MSDPRDTGEELAARAKKEFGTTTDFREAGFILRDGTMLDFSGKSQVRPDERQYYQGQHELDHRQVAKLFDRREGVGRDNALDEFMRKTGAIRFFLTPGDVNVHIEEKLPSEAQVRRLKQAVAVARRLWRTSDLPQVKQSPPALSFDYYGYGRRKGDVNLTAYQRLAEGQFENARVDDVDKLLDRLTKAKDETNPAAKRVGE
jgi:hypothetical protein